MRQVPAGVTSLKMIPKGMPFKLKKMTAGKNIISTS